MVPRSGRSSPVIRLKSVVLPAPFGPMTSRRSPGSTTRSTVAVTRSPPNDFSSPRTASAVMGRRRSPSLPAGDPGGVAGEPHDVQARVRAVGQVHEPALVVLHVVGLDGDLAAARSVLHAALARPLGGRRDVEPGLAR